MRSGGSKSSGASGALGVVLSGVLAATLFTQPTPVAADHLVGSYALSCNAEFPCADEIRPRVDFWIEVFSKHTSGHVILHDSHRPARVYKVLKTKARCSRRREARTIKRERLHIRKQLRTIAGKLEKGRPLAKADRHLSDLFLGESAAEMRRAAARIRCQEGNRDRFAEALRRYGTYREIVATALRKGGLPADIEYLPFVESAYNPHAYSRVGAAGMWQIMPRTGRTLGLRISAELDERLDPYAATDAAVRYLLDSYATLSPIAARHNGGMPGESLYPFVITSYNYGVRGTARALRAHGPDFIRVLEKHKGRSFRVAVKNFYASFLAARYVARNAKTFFPDVQRGAPLRADRLVLDRATSIGRLTRHLGVSVAELKRLNPGLRRLVWSGRRLVPRRYALKLPPRSDGWENRVVAMRRLPAEQTQSSEFPHKVRRGETACGIARAYRVSCRELIDLNRLGRRALIRIGQILAVPGTTKTIARAVAADGRYQVRRGDTACRIARSFKVSCPKFIAANNLGSGALIHVGQSLVIPGAALTVAAKSPAVAAARPKVVRSTPVPPGQGTTPAVPASKSPKTDLTDAFGLGEDLFVTVRGSGKDARYTVRVEPEETLGHLTDWLRSGSPATLRKLNGLGGRNVLRIGQHIRLPIRDARHKADFEQRRVEFHRAVEEGFGRHYRITGVESYRIKRGDSGWAVSQKFQVPLWLLRRYNPDLLFSPPAVGERVRIPLIEDRNEQAAVNTASNGDAAGAR